VRAFFSHGGTENAPARRGFAPHAGQSPVEPMVFGNRETHSLFLRIIIFLTKSYLRESNSEFIYSARDCKSLASSEFTIIERQKSHGRYILIPKSCKMPGPGEQPEDSG